MPHPNATLPCGTDSAKRRHAAHGEQCPVCNPTDTTAAPAAADQQTPSRQEATGVAL